MPTSLDSDIFFLALLLASPGCNIAGWWQLAKADSGQRDWREGLAAIGLVGNSAAIILPAIYAFSSAKEMEWNSALIACLVVCGFSFVAGAMAVKQVRPWLMISSIATAAFWVMVPVGGL